MLDEIDKLGADYRGDPAAALLEILDPEQNNTFTDHYLDLPFDLSKVLFIATANQLGPIPPPLRDRMDIIALAGYSDREKLEIAKRYLVPRQVRENGLTPEQLEIADDAIGLITARYTREAGVRQLERTIGRIARKVALKIAQGQTEKVIIDAGAIHDYLGGPKFYPEEARKELPAGVATGMAVTEMGGEILFIEANLLPGGHGFTITGQLGEVMQESARAAQSYLWSHAQDFGIDPSMFKNYGVHRRCDSQRWTKRRCHDHRRSGIALHRPARAPRYSDDGRDNSVRPGFSRRRDQGKGSRCASRRHSSNNPDGAQ